MLTDSPEPLNSPLWWWQSPHGRVWDPGVLGGLSLEEAQARQPVCVSPCPGSQGLGGLGLSLDVWSHGFLV